MKVFMTGGTGFIGERIVRRLTARGHEVTCLTRHPHKAVALRELGVVLVEGDITERESMRAAMSAADAVIHTAGWYEVGLPTDAESRMERINVHGTDNVLGLAAELNIPHILYTSTAFILGDTHGRVVDETYRRDSPFNSVYDRTKYQAHRVAEGYISKGAPVTVLMPAAVYGPGDHSLVGTLLRLLLRRMLPVLPGASTGLTFVYVDDVAEGHVLALEKGQPGATYCLGGEVMTLGDAMQTVARLAGVPAPLLHLDARWFAPLTPVTHWLENFIPLPSITSTETLQLLGNTWWVSSAQAERELGYTHRAIEEGMAETVIWEATRLREQPTLVQPKGLLALAAIILALVALLRRKR
jgi:dihydroflavonol-4-reductase